MKNIRLEILAFVIALGVTIAWSTYFYFHEQHARDERERARNEAREQAK